MSKMDLAHVCAYGFRKDVPKAPREIYPATRIGTLVHGLLEADLNNVSIVRENVDPHELVDAKRIYDQLLSWVNPRRSRLIKCEFGMRYDTRTDTAAFGPKRGEPGYDDVPAHVLPGTGDLVLRGVDGVLEVVDVKTGKKEYTSPAQLAAQAVAVSRIYGANVVRVGFLYPRKTKCDEPEWETLDEDRLDAEAGRIGRVLRKLPIAEPVRGDWCWKCDARRDCPAWNVNAA